MVPLGRQGAATRHLTVRAGVHTGECELVGPKPAGLAVHIGARMPGEAGNREIIVTSTVRDLVAGSGFTFEDRGEHEAEGRPGGVEALRGRAMSVCSTTPSRV